MSLTKHIIWGGYIDFGPPPEKWQPHPYDLEVRRYMDGPKVIEAPPRCGICGQDETFWLHITEREPTK